MTISEKCEAILKKMMESVDKQENVSLSYDMGGNSVTLQIGLAHTHCGYDEGTFENLIDQVYNSLHGGPGLSWE